MEGFIYDSNTNQCRACSGCQGCFGGVSNCTKCSSGKYLFGQNCVTDCPQFSVDNSSGQCVACELEGCELCSSTTSCSRCQDGYYLMNLTCQANCSSGQYSDNSTRTCESIRMKPFNFIECNSLCGDCTGGNNFLCSNCSNISLAIDSGIPNIIRCFDKCPDGYYLSGTACLSTHLNFIIKYRM